MLTVLGVTATTPWIALVSCDYNATNASQVVDIFTLARDKGAVSAVRFRSFSTIWVADATRYQAFVLFVLADVCY